MAVDSSGTRGYVTNSATGTVSVIDLATNTVTATVTGFTFPRGITTAGVVQPVVTAVSPTSGPEVGGTLVTITGTDFLGATAVSFGSTAAASFTVVSDTTITATAPAASAIGTVDVTVTTPVVTSARSSADQYSYTYPFGGFLAPVAGPPSVNTVHAGRAIPINFQLGGNQGLGILAPGFPQAQQVSCTTNAPVGAPETATAGGSGLQFDPSTNTYTYVWKTPQVAAGTCMVFILGLNDGTFHTANFQLA